MQDRYTGDIGDFAKFGLLRALGTGSLLGVAWYLFHDEPKKGDGKFIDYLNNPDKWRHLDPELFDTLCKIVKTGPRGVEQIECHRVLEGARFSDRRLEFKGTPGARAKLRAGWFRKVLADLDNCDIVFADPDNGLCEDPLYKMAKPYFWKRLPLSEAHVLAAGRTGVLYHHNTMRKGGHLKEIEYWLKKLGQNALALYWRPFSNRTFFVLQPTRVINQRIEAFVAKWSPHFELYGPEKTGPKNDDPFSKSKVCPECGHEFKGKGWVGIDAHWKAEHNDIMPYEAAWPIIKRGEKPSDA